MIRFAYLRDELFLGASGAYALNRWCLKPLLSWPFLHNHFNDLLTIPAALPVVLWIQRIFRLRGSDAPPCASEIILHLIIWTILCEYVGPFWLARGVSDPLDVLAYTLGGWVAWMGWNRIPLKSLNEDQEEACFPENLPSGGSSGRRPALARPSQPALGMLRPRRLGHRQNPSPQVPS